MPLQLAELIIEMGEGVLQLKAVSVISRGFHRAEGARARQQQAFALRQTLALNRRQLGFPARV